MLVAVHFGASMNNNKFAPWQTPLYIFFAVLTLVTIATYIYFLPPYLSVQTEIATEIYKDNLINLEPRIYGYFTVTRDLLVTLSFWISAGILAARKWRSPFVVFLSMVLLLAGVTFPNTLLAEIENAQITIVAKSLRYLSYSFFVLFLYLFPNGKFFPRWLRIPALLWPVILFIPVYGDLFGLWGNIPDLVIRDIQVILQLTYVLVGVISQFFRYRNYSEIVEKQQTQWIIFGFGLVLSGAFIINFSYFILRQFFSEAHAFLIYDFGFITFFGATAASAFPIIVCISIFRYRLWDLQPFLSRTIVNLVVSAILFIVAMLTVWLTRFTIGYIAGQDTEFEIILASFFVVIVTVLLYAKVRRKITELVFPKQIQYDQEIKNLSSNTRVLFDKSGVLKLLHTNITSAIDTNFCNVYEIREDGNPALIYSSEKDFEFVDIHSITKEIYREGSYFPGSLTESFFLALSNNQIPTGNQTMGILEVGPKKSGKGFTHDEIAFIQSLGSEAALALYVSHMHTQSTILAAALESTINGVALVNISGEILWVNPAYSSLTGFSINELVGKSFINLSDVLENNKEEILASVSNNTAWAGTGASMRKNGSHYHEETTITPVISANGETTHMVVIINDVTPRVEMQEKFEYLATHDSLTNLPNRVLFSDRLEQALANIGRSGNQGAILYLDLDDFKAVNDVYTHEMGDLLLKNIAEKIKSTVRAGDTIARIGGDEFALLMSEIESSTSAGVFGQRIVQLLEEPVTINGVNLQISGSIGISVFPEDGTLSFDLMRNADIAMYRAKNNGKGKIAYFTEAMSKEVESNLEIRNILRDAVKKQYVKLFFQPQIELPSNCLRGVEALLRIEHPEKGFSR